MPTLRFPPQADSWSASIALAQTLTLQDSLWQRPQVEGITIDGPDSRDLDDAIWIEQIPTGAILSVHIADVSELVAMGSILDKVAIARTTTQYFKNGNAPMLPRSLSEDKLSLLEYQDRPTLTVQVTLNHKAEIEQTEIFESWLRSRRKFSYREAEAAQQDLHSPFSTLLQTAYRWAELLYRDRLNTGAIGATLTAQGDWLTEEGSLIQGQRHNSHLLIQEFMILANRAVAQWLAERDIPALYRNHTARAIAPDRETMYQTMLSLGSAQAIRQRLQSWLNRAEYGPTLIGHFALNLPAYCHFTSPIRRLADLINHRIIKAQLKQQENPYTKVELEQLGQHIAQVTRDQEEETSEYFKTEHQKVYQTQIQSPEAIKHLSPKEFTRILKYACEKGELKPIAQAIETRLASGNLAVQDLYVLLFQSSDVALQQQVYQYLKGHVQEAASIIAMAPDQQEDWESTKYVEQNEKSPFIIWLEIKIAGEALTTVHPAEHQRKQPAHHHACLLWIEACLQNALVSPDQRVEPSPPEPELVTLLESESKSTQLQETKADEPLKGSQQQMYRHLTKLLQESQNFVGILNDLCQGLQWQAPTYDFTEESAQVFYCECQLQAQNDLITGKGIANVKQQAKAAAARDVLEQLQAQVIQV
jgi:ribonuclease R